MGWTITAMKKYEFLSISAILISFLFIVNISIYFSTKFQLYINLLFNAYHYVAIIILILLICYIIFIALRKHPGYKNASSISKEEDKIRFSIAPQFKRRNTENVEIIQNSYYTLNLKKSFRELFITSIYGLIIISFLILIGGIIPFLVILYVDNETIIKLVYRIFILVIDISLALSLYHEFKDELLTKLSKLTYFGFFLAAYSVAIVLLPI